MLNADGTSTAFGLSFREHDNRKMQHILRAYNRLPENPNIRSTLYLALTSLENSLLDEDSQPIRDWLRDGGSLSDFPGPSAAQGPPINGDERSNTAENAFVPQNPYASYPGGFQPHGWGTAAGIGEANGTEDQEDNSDDSIDDNEEDEEQDASQGQDEDNSDEQDESEEGEDDEATDESDSSDYIGPGQSIEIPEGYKECCICCEQFAPDNFPESTKITATCNHDREEVVCIPCIRKTIQTGLDNGETRRIYCVLCPEFFKLEDVKKYGTVAIISRYLFSIPTDLPPS